MDLVFIDANHAYSFVKADTATAFKLLATGGVIVWDDYVWLPEYPECDGVATFLHEFSKSKPCFRLSNTRLAVYVDDQP